MLVANCLRMWSVMDTCRMQRHHRRLDVITAKEIAVMIEKYFIVIRVAMIERYFQCLRTFFDRTWQEGTDHGVLAHEGRMNRRREMNSVRHNGANVPHVDLIDC